MTAGLSKITSKMFLKIQVTLSDYIIRVGTHQMYTISGNGMRLELLPSKGLSIYEAFYNERPYFWKPPLEKLKNPDDFDPLGITYLKGTPAVGYRWLELFTGGVEMLGLDNSGVL